MAIQPGDRLGAYEILSPLGAGGMGVVYRARDTRLGRDVAIKTLPDDVAADLERRSRFEREARALAALSHANVASIFGFEQIGAAHLLVMELVEGETLADWIARGPIAIERALPLFLQIAAGLEAAHAKGIIHRDLKPANIKIAHSASASSREIKPGAVKILDFGLAKALESEGEARAMAADATHSPTLTLQATMRGVLLGTAGYMSPEQAEGEPADQRADIWAFGVCLLEALSGRPVFAGSNASRILASVLKDEPDLSRLPPATPSAMRRLLRRCLEKDRDKRLRDIADARLDLEEALEALVAEASPAPVAAPRRTPRSWMAVAGALLLGSALGLVIDRSFRSPTTPASVARFVLNPAPNVTGGQSAGNEVALSADGKTIVYVAQELGERVLFARRIDQLDGAAIRGVESFAFEPFLSPDGRWVGYTRFEAPGAASGTLRKIALEGGVSVEITKVGEMAGASWGPDDEIIFGQMEGPLRRVSARGGEAHDVVELRDGEIAHRFPEWMPGGRVVLLTVVNGPESDAAGGSFDHTSIEAVTLATGERKPLVQVGSQARFLPPGHLLYAVGSTLYAVAFDPERLELRGSPVPVEEHVGEGYTRAAKYAVSESGALAFVYGGGFPASMAWVDRNGHEEPVGAPLQSYGSPRLSPDGKRVAFDLIGDLDIGIWDLERGASSRLTVSHGWHIAPLWSPDGRTIFYSTGLANGDWAIVGSRADGSGDPFTIVEQPVSVFAVSVTADGGGMLAMRGFSKVPTARPFEIVLLDTSGKADPKVLLGAAGSNFAYPEPSPDGRFLAYASDESGTDEVYVRPYPELGSGKSQVSSGGGNRPQWSRDGKEIFFLDNGNRINVAPVTTRDGSLQIGRAEILIETPYAPTSPGRTFDLSADGKRFLVTKGAAAGAEPNGRIVYVQNWLDDLRRTVPSGAREVRK